MKDAIMQKDERCSNCNGTGIAPECPFTTIGVHVSFPLRFLHMLSHVPLGFGNFTWAVRFHDWTGDLQEQYDATVPAKAAGKGNWISADALSLHRLKGGGFSRENRRL